MKRGEKGDERVQVHHDARSIEKNFHFSPESIIVRCSTSDGFDTLRIPSNNFDGKLKKSR